jgi:hypothetical protein
MQPPQPPSKTPTRRTTYDYTCQTTQSGLDQRHSCYTRNDKTALLGTNMPCVKDPNGILWDSTWVPKAVTNSQHAISLSAKLEQKQARASVRMMHHATRHGCRCYLMGWNAGNTAGKEGYIYCDGDMRGGWVCQQKGVKRSETAVWMSGVVPVVATFSPLQWRGSSVHVLRRYCCMDDHGCFDREADFFCTQEGVCSSGLCHPPRLLATLSDDAADEQAEVFLLLLTQPVPTQLELPP